MEVELSLRSTIAISVRVCEGLCISSGYALDLTTCDTTISCRVTSTQGLSWTLQSSRRGLHGSSCWGHGFEASPLPTPCVGLLTGAFLSSAPCFLLTSGHVCTLCPGWWHLLKFSSPWSSARSSSPFPGRLFSGSRIHPPPYHYWWCHGCHQVCLILNCIHLE